MTENARNAIIRVLRGRQFFRMPARHKIDESSEWAYGTIENRGNLSAIFKVSDRSVRPYTWTININSIDTYDLEILELDCSVALEKDSVGLRLEAKTIIIEFDKAVLVNQNF